MYRLHISPEISLSFFINILLLVLLTVALYHTLILLKKYQKDASSALQYSLEKKSYLITTIIQFSLFAYIFLLLFFTHTLDTLAELIPGAMCGAGVVGGNEYGLLLLLLKFMIIIFSLLWISLHEQDMQQKNFPYFKKKFYLFILLYALIFATFIIEILFYSELNFESPVLCCSSLYGQTANTTLFGLSIPLIVSLFYLTYFFIMFSLYFKKRGALIFSALIFIPLSYYSITYFFSPYIYELPTHTCPFCLLHQENYFIGYFIYFSLIFSLYYNLKVALIKLTPKAQKLAYFFTTLFVLLCSYKFIAYYISKFIVI